MDQQNTEDTLVEVRRKNLQLTNWVGVGLGRGSNDKGDYKK